MSYTNLPEFKDFRLSAEQAIGAVSEKWLVDRFASWRLIKTWDDYREWLRYYDLEAHSVHFTPQTLR